MGRKPAFLLSMLIVSTVGGVSLCGGEVVAGETTSSVQLQQQQRERIPQAAAMCQRVSPWGDCPCCERGRGGFVNGDCESRIETLDLPGGRPHCGLKECSARPFLGGWSQRVLPPPCHETSTPSDSSTNFLITNHESWPPWTRQTAILESFSFSVSIVYGFQWISIISIQYTVSSGTIRHHPSLAHHVPNNCGKLHSVCPRGPSQR